MAASTKPSQRFRKKNPITSGTATIHASPDKMMRCLRLRGAEMILNPTWGAYGEGNTSIMITRAYENGIPVCFAHPKQALICSPGGAADPSAEKPVAVLESNRPGVLVHDINLSENPKAKRTKNMAGSHPVQNRRPELYGRLVRRTSPTPRDRNKSRRLAVTSTLIICD